MVGRIAARMGKPFMPWQQHVMDVALEIDPSTGDLAYREVRLGVPRQSGKTTITLSRVIWRAETSHLLGGRQRMLYAAQTGKDARAKWQEDFVEDLAGAAVMKGRYRVILTTARERVRFQSASTFAPTAIMRTSGHGPTLDDGTLDEAWAQVDDRIEDAWRPAMITRKQAQFWVVSTAGDRSSLYLRDKVLKGRELIDSSTPTRVAYFEWSAPHDADPESPETWARCMPALGLTIGVPEIRHEFDTIKGGLPAFRRAYLNQWADEFDDEEWALPKASWRACADPYSIRAGRPALAADISLDRAFSSLAYAAPNASGMPMAQVIRYAEGSTWLAAEAKKEARRTNAKCLVIDGTGPIAEHHAKLQAAVAGQCPVRVLTGPEIANACGSFKDSVVTEQFRHTDQDVLNQAVRGASEIKVVDRFRYSRRASSADISPLYGVLEALAGLSLQAESRYEEDGFTTL